MSEIHRERISVRRLEQVGVWIEVRPIYGITGHGFDVRELHVTTRINDVRHEVVEVLPPDDTVGVLERVLEIASQRMLRLVRKTREREDSR